MTTGVTPICMFCQHYRADVTEGPMVCKAFPKGIPKRILESAADHRKPFPGDHGIRWEQRLDGPRAPEWLFDGLGEESGE